MTTTPNGKTMDMGSTGDGDWDDMEMPDGPSTRTEPMGKKVANDSSRNTTQGGIGPMPMAHHTQAHKDKLTRACVDVREKGHRTAAHEAMFRKDDKKAGHDHDECY